MLAIFLDIQTEIQDISHECDILKRKQKRRGQKRRGQFFTIDKIII